MSITVFLSDLGEREIPPLRLLELYAETMHRTLVSHFKDAQDPAMSRVKEHVDAHATP